MKCLLIACLFFLPLPAIAGYVTTTYRTQFPEQIGDQTHELSGRLGFVYETGGVPWRAIRIKFKKIWSVYFETMDNFMGKYAFIYDRSTEKVKAVNLVDGSEMANTTVITETFWTAKGER